MMPLAQAAAAPLLSLAIDRAGQTQFSSKLPKLEAVKLLLNVIEELRMQAYHEHGRLVQVASIAPPAAAND